MSNHLKIIYFGALILALSIAQMSIGDFFNIKIYRFIIIFYFAFIIFKIKVKLYSKNYFLLSLNIIIFFLAALFSDKIYINIISDFQQIFWWFPFSVLLISLLNSKEKVAFFLRKFNFSLLVLGVIISIISIIKFMNLNAGIVWDSLTTADYVIIGGSSLNADYNVYAFGLSFFIMSYKNFFDTTKSNFLKVLLLLIMFLDFYLLFYSGSRRGLVLLLILFLILPFNNFSKISQLNISIFNLRNILLIISLYFLFILSINFLQKIDSDGDASNLILDRLETSMSFINLENNRSQRWVYALNIYSDYNSPQLIFGKGFNYLDKFSKKFYLTAEDYPHNFLLSALLYSGILGFLSMLYMVLFVLRSLKYNRFPLLISYGFIFVLILQFTSSNSLFSVGITVFLITFLLNFNKIKINFE